MKIVYDVQLGPALPVIAYDDIEEALVEANKTAFGLGGSVWGIDVNRARAVAQRLRAGTVWINAHRVLQAHQPIRGLKASGYGFHGGLLGLAETTEVQVVWQGKQPAYAVWDRALGTGDVRMPRRCPEGAA